MVAAVDVYGYADYAACPLWGCVVLIAYFVGFCVARSDEKGNARALQYENERQVTVAHVFFMCKDNQH